MTTARTGSRARAWIALVGLALPLFVLSVDAYGVGVLLPDIAADLDINTLQASVVVSATAIGSAAPLLLVGRLADRFGPRGLLLGGIVGFAVASAICAWAGSYGILVAGRWLQGFASACCITTSLAVIDAMFDDDRRPVAVGIWAAIGGVGGAVGPLVGSAVTSLWSWRAFFAVNLGVGVVALTVLTAVVPHTAGDRTRSLETSRLLVLALGLGLAVGAFQHVGGDGWHVSIVVTVLVGLGLVGVAAVDRGRGPLVAPSILAPRTFRAGTAVATLSNWGSGVVFALVPPALTATQDLSVLGTGMLFAAFSAPFAVGGAVSGPLVRALGGPGACGASSLVQAAGLAGLGLVGVGAPLAAVAASLAVAGFGNGVAYSASTSLALADVPTGDAGEASGVLSTWRLLGLTVGVAVSTMVVDAIAGREAVRDTAGVDGALLLAGGIAALGLLAVRGAGHARR